MVFNKVRDVPYGCVTTYGEVSKAIGLRNYARHVGFALRSLEFAGEKDVPWWRESIFALHSSFYVPGHTTDTNPHPRRYQFGRYVHTPTHPNRRAC